MLSSAQFVSPLPALLPPGGQPGASGQPGSGSAGGPSFSQFLNDQPEMLTPPAHTDPVPAAPDSAPPAANTAATNAAARRKEGSATPPKATGTGGPRPPEGSAGKPADAQATAAASATDAADAATAMGDTTATQAAPDDDTQQASSLTEFAQLIGLALPGQPAAPASPVADTPVTTSLTGADAIDTTATAATAAAGTRTVRAPRGTPGADDAGTDTSTRPTVTAGDDGSTKDRRLADTALRPADSPRSKAIDLGTDKAASPSRSPSTDTLQASSARATAESGSTPARSTSAIEGAAPNFAALLAQSAPATVAGGDLTPAPVTGQVHAALHSPTFAPELAASVSLLAADGVQHAELQLNPADMGPVAVQIIVDGAQAQVSFHAVQAETRQALEQSLPDLAAALQGQGLTLSGGGVFQQSPRDAQGGSDDRGSGSRTAGRTGGAGGPITAAGSTATASVRRAAGLLDTFA